MMTVPLSECKNTIPISLNEAVQLLEKSTFINKIRSHILNDHKELLPLLTQPTLGRYIYNIWRLWDDNSPIVEWFNRNNIYSIDDITLIVLKSTFRSIRNEKINFQSQVNQCTISH
jgi:hypothetical protein